MPSYRVETASSGCAVCIETECKAAGIKIEKDELRLGVWVAFEDRGSWKWKHWYGCVTGKQLQNMREYLEDPAHPGVYRWDFLDGYEGDEKNSLDKHPDLQEKVRRVVTQGFIDPQDWNGDPEMNKLGETGIRTAETKKQMRVDKKHRENEIEELKAQVAALTAERDALKASGASTKKADVKVGIAKEQLEVAEMAPATPAKRGVAYVKTEEKPAKRKRASKSQNEPGTDDEEETKPAKKVRASKVKKEEAEDEEEEVMPAKKSRVKVKKEEDEPASSTSAPKKRVTKNKAVYEDADAVEAAESAKKAPAKRGRSKKVVAKEEADAEEVKEQPQIKKAPAKRGRGKKAGKEEAVEEEVVAAAVLPKEEAVGEEGVDATVPSKGETVEAEGVDANIPSFDGAADEKTVAPPSKPRKTAAKKGAKKAGRMTSA